MKLTIEIELTEEQQGAYEEMINDTLLNVDVFRHDCSGAWMKALTAQKDESGLQWLVAIEDEVDRSVENEVVLDFRAGIKEHRFPTGYKIWNRAKAEQAMKYGIAKYGLDDWLDGTASDAYAVDDAVQVALLGEIVYC